MRFQPLSIPDVILVEPDVFRDDRGYVLETYRKQRYSEGGIDVEFVQDNHSFSRQKVLRGLHVQFRRPQAKLVRVIAGEVFDVAVDIRRGSATFGRWVGEVLSGENCRQMYIPAGFAHGFCVLSHEAHVGYKMTDVYDPGGEFTILWNDPEIGVEWPVAKPILSPKDAAGRQLKEWLDSCPP